MQTIGNLKAILRKRGFRCRQGKGDHTIWTRHGQLRPIVLSGHDGDDAPRYQEARVRKVEKHHRRRFQHHIKA
jgi:hypothetical protein